MPPKKPYLIKPEERGHRKKISSSEESFHYTIRLPKSMLEWANKKGRNYIRALFTKDIKENP